MKEDIGMHWTTSNGISSSDVEGLGRIQVYRDNGGYAIDINCKRAWSSCVGTLDENKDRITLKVHGWRYLNKFMAVP